MKSKMLNEVYIEGYLYDYKLDLKKTGETSKNPGTEYITGYLSIATDENLENIVNVNYTYITEVTKSGSQDSRFAFLKKIIDEEYKAVMRSSKESAIMVRINSNLELNDWHNRHDNYNLVSSLRNGNGFLHLINRFEKEKEEERSKFKADMVIAKVVRQEEDEERGLPEQMTIEGYIFNFRKDVLPVKFVTFDKQGMDYLEAQDISKSNPLCTKVWGSEITQVTKKQQVSESAFGDEDVTYLESVRKLFLVTGMSNNPYDWDSEEFITAMELKEGLQNRQIMLAERLADQKRRDSGNNSNNGRKMDLIEDDDFGF